MIERLVLKERNIELVGDERGGNVVGKSRVAPHRRKMPGAASFVRRVDGSHIGLQMRIRGDLFVRRHFLVSSLSLDSLGFG